MTYEVVWVQVHWGHPFSYICCNFKSSVSLLSKTESIPLSFISSALLSNFVQYTLVQQFLILIRYHGLCWICCLSSVWNRSVKLASWTKVTSVPLIRGLVAILDRSKLKLAIFKLHRTVEFIHLWSIQLDISWYTKSLRIDTKRSMLTDSTSTMMCFDNPLLWKQKNAFKQIWVYVTRQLGR